MGRVRRETMMNEFWQLWFGIGGTVITILFALLVASFFKEDNK